MKLALAFVVLVVFVLSFVADYKWRRWMAERRREHQRPASSDADRAPHP
jgi:hypothetical protein